MKKGDVYMINKSLTKWMRCVIVGMTLCGILIYFVIFPVIGSEIIKYYPELNDWFYPWISFIWLTAIPCFGVLCLLWRIITNIKSGKIFSLDNIKYLKYNSRFAVIDSVLFLSGNIILLFLNMSHPAVLLFSLFIVFMGISIAVLFEGLSRIGEKAYDLQIENEFTI